MSNRDRKGKNIIVINSDSKADKALVDERPWQKTSTGDPSDRPGNAMSDAEFQRRVESGFFSPPGGRPRCGAIKTE
jgi:hypothetical protein